jgi:hypothetical protein
MSGFRFPAPEAIWPILLKNNIRTEQDLIDYVEKHPLRYDIGKYYSFLWYELAERRVFLFYQLHLNNGKKPFLEHFNPSRQRNFLDKGIVDEESLKAYARIHITTHLMDKGHPQYDYFKSIIAEEPEAIDHFYSNFSERIKNGLRQAGVESREELIELVRQTGLVGVHQIGKKSKDEILTYLGMDLEELFTN